MGTFFGFILLLLLLLVIVPILWIVSSVFKLRRRFKRRVDDAARGQREYTARETHFGGSHKVFAKDVGEYVSFEEIIVDRESEEKPPHRDNVKPEPQISDVEFEEIIYK